MLKKTNIQQESLQSLQIKELLLYFFSVRKITNRELAESIRYQEGYLSNARKGKIDGGEKLLHALESFFVIDNVNRIRDLDFQIKQLNGQKTVLQEQTVEKFYAERQVLAETAGQRSELNDGKTGSKPNSEQTAETLAAGRKIVLALHGALPPAEDTVQPGSTVPPKLKARRRTSH